MSIRKFFARIFNKGPDVLLIGDEGELSLHRSQTVAGLRIVNKHGSVLLLQSDGTVRGCRWVKTWEAL